MKTPHFARIRSLSLLEVYRRWLVPASWPAVLSCIVFLTLAPRGLALPQGGQVVAGQVDITQVGNTLNLTQASRAAIVNWQGFNIAPNELVRVLQSGADAAMLARVTGGDPSQLLGQLKADGKLFLINPKGIVVGQGAIIDTVAFLASALDVADADFLKGGAMTFKGDSAAGVVNLGTVIAREGNVLLIAHTVKNAGEMSAAKGTAGLAAGTEVYLASPDAPTFVIKTNLATTEEKTGVENSGVIHAAQAELKAAGGSIYDLAVNQSGLVKATGFESRNGRIVLTSDGGSVAVTGSATAQNASGSGGEILAGGDYRGANADIANATRTFVGAEAKLDASATIEGAAAGRVIVWANEHTTFLGRAAARGAGGGFAEVSGKHTLGFRPADVIDLGPGGTLLLDPDALVVATSDPGTAASFTSVATLQAQLAASNVTLDTSTSAGDITFSNAVTWTTGNTLRVNSGNNINLNANLTGGAGSALSLYAGKQGMDIAQGPNATQGNLNQVAGSTINVGTLTVGLNTTANVPNNNGTRGGSYNLDGLLNVGTLQIDLTGQTNAVTANNAANSIGALKTTGSGGYTGSIDVVDGAGDLDLQLALANANTFEVRAVTPGTLTLKTGTAMSFSSGADVILASTGGNFVNEAGASAIGTNGRFLIYSGTTGATVQGGLAGTEEFSRTFAGNPPGDYSGDTLSRFLYRAAGTSLPQLTYRANAASRNYGYADPTFGFTVSGEQPGLAVSSNVTGAPTFSTAATATSSVGNYTINIFQGTLASSVYDFNFVAGTLAINAAPVTLTVNNANRLYGDANPGFSLASVGLRNGDALSAVGNFLFNTTATSTSNAGDYTVSASHSGGGSGNYMISAINSGTLTVNRAPLTVTAPSFARVYGQDTTVSLNDLVYSGLKNSFDALNTLSATTAPAGTGVGTYAVTASGTSTNYDVTFVPGSLTITPASLNIRADDVTRTYGDANPTLTATATGLVNSDAATSAYSGLTLTTTATQASNVGTYSIVPTGATAANYSLNYTNGTFTISRAVLNATVGDATRSYSQSNPAFSLGGITGFKNGDTASVLTGLTFSTSADNGSVPGRYAINASASAQNYTLNFAPGFLTIGRTAASFSLGSFTRTYGDAPFSFTPTLTGFSAADEAQARGIWGLDFTDSITRGAGVYALTFETRNASLANFYSQFYDITFNPGSLTVTRAPLQLIARNVSTPYGTASATNGFNVVGLRNGDTASVVSGARLNELILFSTAPVGTYPITFASGGTAENYAITTVDGAYTIGRQSLLLRGPTLTTYEDIVPPLDPAQPRLVPGGPQFRVIGTIPFIDRGVKAGEVIQIDLKLVAASGTTLADITNSYDLTFEPGSLTVVPDPMKLTVTLNDSFTTELDPAVFKEKPPIWVKPAADFSKPLGVEDFASIITGDPAKMIAAIKAYWNTAEYFTDLNEAERRILDDFVLGRISADQLAELLRTDKTAQSVLMPIFASMAMELINRGSAYSVAEQRLVYFMNDSAAKQRRDLAAGATERYNAWFKESEERKTGTLGTATPYAIYSMNLMPDVVTGAQTDVLAVLFGVGMGTAAGGATGGTIAALSKAGMVVKKVFPKLAREGAKALAARGLALAGPIGLVVDIAVTVTEIAINAINESDKHRVEYQRVLARAAETEPKVGSMANYRFEMKPPQNDEDRVEVLTSFMNVFGGAFGGG